MVLHSGAPDRIFPHLIHNVFHLVSSRFQENEISLVLGIQGVFEMRGKILTTSYWLHVELVKNI
jgi:hypothetical protein